MADSTFVPGKEWRILAKDGDKEIHLENQGVFDELVVDNWFHLEQMDETSWWIRVADARLTIETQGDGTAKLLVEREFYEQIPRKP